MADKKKMSVADMLAAARKADGDAGSAPAETVPAADEAAAPAETAAPAAKPVAAKPASGGGRMSVAEMLAAARGGGAGAAPAAPAEKKAAPPKPAAKPAAAAKVEAAAPTERDNASIMTAARKTGKAGPMSKAEAAAKEKADPVAKEKPKVFVPPMPEKPAYALPKPVAVEKPKAVADESRRAFLNIGFWSVGLVTFLWTMASLKFLFPNVRREPPSKFKVGFPDAFPPGVVQTKFIPQFGVWVANAEINGVQQIYALKSVCTHLGCTPNWLEAEQKFKCPCHGSGFYKDGINFEGPAPRPLERYAIRIADDGQIEIDKSRTFQEEMGQWEDATSFIPV
ncbi:MAG: Rieske (2Fe-2S) protein [Bythopirellula sp.]|nr:Rieske (2Fe-2S) protein [Bythopirellula sp.]